mmetsp:Transcript_10949/g.31770  ORF Transcript_10949/g.31770 Transcript_10949/m.31770 type:complete len:310 (+) Transcript_10949:148-1077(+)
MLYSSTTNYGCKYSLLVVLVAPLLLGIEAFYTAGTSSRVSLLVSLSRNEPPMIAMTCARIFSGCGSPAPRGALHQSSPDSSSSSSETASSEPTMSDGDFSSKLSDESEAAAAPNSSSSTAATNTINERLMAELRQAEQTERFGSKGKKMGLVDGYGRARKTDAEIQAAIAEARDLNGVNPIVAILGSFFAFGVAGALWVVTNKLGGFFASHPPETEVYFVLRTAQVFRNVVMGMISLASGFFGVTGLGIFGMGVRVAYGVMKGELDPTPIKNNKSSSAAASKKETVDLGNMMDLMMNKKPGRRGGGKKK